VLKRLLIGALVFSSLVFAASGGGASADEGLHAVSASLEVPATNGYRATVIAVLDPAREAGVGILTLSRKGSSASYATRSVAVSADSIEAKFGSFGEVDTHLVTTGDTTTERPACGGEPITFPSGRWEGTIHFRGEGGYAEVDATSARVAASPFLDLLCGEERNEGVRGHSPGALLELRRRRGRERLRLSVRKNKPVGPTRIEVEETERRGAIEIERSDRLAVGSGSFDFELPPGRATIAPPKPFTGYLAFAKRPGSSPLLKGNLRVDLPGRPAVPILGAGTTHANLVRAVLNPSHPF
jgi:hypothetical protein